MCPFWLFPPAPNGTPTDLRSGVTFSVLNLIKSDKRLSSPPFRPCLSCHRPRQFAARVRCLCGGVAASGALSLWIYGLSRVAKGLMCVIFLHCRYSFPLCSLFLYFIFPTHHNSSQRRWFFLLFVRCAITFRHLASLSLPILPTNRIWVFYFCQQKVCWNVLNGMCSFHMRICAHSYMYVCVFKFDMLHMMSL